MTRTCVVLFNRDLRVHDHPALSTACRTTDRVVPLFVVDPRLKSSANRRRFLAESLADLRESLRERGGDLVVRRGDPAVQAVRLAREVGAIGIAASEDASAFARARQRRLAEACERAGLALLLEPGVTVVPPGRLRPSGGGDHYKVFTPYWRAWQALERRPAAPTPRAVRLPDGVTGDDLLAVLGSFGAERELSPRVVPGGERAALARLRDFARRSAGYAEQHDDMAGDASSRLSPYLHFGCLSPLTLAQTPGLPEAFVRQLCWRDFYTQVLGAFPDLPDRAYRAGAVEQWRGDDEALGAWRTGLTGVPVVDAGMRQLLAEGWMHNRARLITAGYLTKTLGLDWRAGADWFMRWLLDADTANNYGNWQWVAGTGNDTKPYRRFNPVRQAHRFDPDGDYVRRYVPELAGIEGGRVHEPWLLPDGVRRGLDYPPPLALSSGSPPGADVLF